MYKVSHTGSLCCWLPLKNFLLSNLCVTAETRCVVYDWYFCRDSTKLPRLPRIFTKEKVSDKLRAVELQPFHFSFCRFYKNIQFHILIDFPLPVVRISAIVTYTSLPNSFSKSAQLFEVWFVAFRSRASGRYAFLALSVYAVQQPPASNFSRQILLGNHSRDIGGRRYSEMFIDCDRSWVT